MTDDDRLAIAARDLQALADGKLADAAAHARNALSGATRATPEGRPTQAKLRRHPGFKAALSRLDELRDALVARVERLRVEQYRASYSRWFAEIPAAYRRSDSEVPPQPLAERARTTLIHGTTPRREIGATTDRAAASLLPVLTVAGNRGTARDAAHDAVAQWERRTAAAVARVAITAANDSQVMADRRAGRDAVAPAYLHDDPTLPE